MDVYIVVTDNGSSLSGDREWAGFENEELAEQYAAARGSSEVIPVSIMGDTMARNFIKEEQAT